MKFFALALATCSFFTTAAAEEWVEQKKAEFLPERQADGDSFGMTVASRWSGPWGQWEKTPRVARTILSAGML
jgi:hypothetical protein